MNTRYQSMPETDGSIVYVRPIAVADLPEELQDEIEGLETVYAVHRTDGVRVAVVRDRALAFALAKQNDIAALSVH